MEKSEPQLMIMMPGTITEDEYIQANQLFLRSGSGRRRAGRILSYVLAGLLILLMILTIPMDGFTLLTALYLVLAALLVVMEPLQRRSIARAARKVFSKSALTRGERVHLLFDAFIEVVTPNARERIQWTEITSASENEQMILLTAGQRIVPLTARMLTPSMAAYLHNFIYRQFGAAARSKYHFFAPVSAQLPEGQVPSVPDSFREPFAQDQPMASFLCNLPFYNTLKKMHWGKALMVLTPGSVILGLLLAFIPDSPPPWWGMVLICLGMFVVLTGLMLLSVYRIWNRSKLNGQTHITLTVYPSGLKRQTVCSVSEFRWDELDVTETRTDIQISYDPLRKDYLPKKQFSDEQYEQLRSLLLRFNARHYASPGGIQPR